MGLKRLSGVRIYKDVGRGSNPLRLQVRTCLGQQGGLTYCNGVNFALDLQCCVDTLVDVSHLLQLSVIDHQDSYHKGHIIPNLCSPTKSQTPALFS